MQDRRAAILADFFGEGVRWPFVWTHRRTVVDDVIVSTTAIGKGVYETMLFGARFEDSQVIKRVEGSMAAGAVHQAVVSTLRALKQA